MRDELAALAETEPKRHLSTEIAATGRTPAAVGPEMEPTTPFGLLAPPQTPKGCEKDWNCSVGQICSEQSQCVAR
jgi:hypothetical protein